MTSIHGHEVLNMMMASPSGFSRDGLIDTIAERFGRDARFHTCSASNLSATELVDLLFSHGKFTESADGWKTEPSRMCQH